MKNILAVCLSFGFSILSFSQQFPAARKTPVAITNHKISFQDDYAWMENMRSAEMIDWVATENAVTENHLEAVRKTADIKVILKEYDTRTTNRLPAKKGDYYFFNFRNKDNKSPSLYISKSLTEKPLEIINPNTIYASSVVGLSGYYPSKSSKLLAYKLTIDGSDNKEIRFYDLESKKKMDDVLYNIKFSNVAWNKDLGIFYKKNTNKRQFERDSTYQLFYHKTGTKQEDDQLVFDASGTESNLDFRTVENKLLIIATDEKKNVSNYYYCDLSSEKFDFVNFVKDDSSNFKFLSYYKDRIYFSSKEYNWGDVRSFSVADRTDEKVIIPQLYNQLLENTLFYKDYIICRYKNVGKNYFVAYDYSGKLIQKVEAPNGMSVSIMDFDSATKDIYYGFYSPVIPYQNYKLNLETGAEQPFYNQISKPKPTLFPLNHFETKKITYKSRDNVDVPITIIYKKGLPLDGMNPTLLEAYGGFGTVTSQPYDIGIIYFLEQGGVYAYAEIRGGGEKGVKWHNDGRGLKKQNTFNDFIDAAEFLIKEHYTSPSKLAISGTSQGGLLMGVAMTQRPDLFQLVIPRMGAFDMIQFDRFTVGRQHKDEYGNPALEAEYKSLLGYSPYHNIKETVNYPTTLIITSENDDRVPPLHSYKFAAKLQNRTAQKNPVYLKVYKDSGHSGKSAGYDDFLNEKADFYSFILYHLK